MKVTTYARYDGHSVTRPCSRCWVSSGGRISRTSRVTAMAMTPVAERDDPGGIAFRAERG
jgi:hypothetical protein